MLFAVLHGSTALISWPPMCLMSPHGYRTLQGCPPRSVSAAMVASSPATAWTPPPLAADEEWIANFDLAAFGSDVKALGADLRRNEGEADEAHFRKIRRWSDACGLLGVATLPLPINPLTIVALSTWTYSRWAMVAHHTCHGGYDRLTDESSPYKGMRFALGGPLRRARDWLDWMLPEAWNLEHNVLHHYKLGEAGDPDLVERNLGFVRQWRGPIALKYAFVLIMSGVWKWVYYSPNTYKQLKLSEHAKTHGGALPEVDGFDPDAALTLGKLMLRPQTRGGLFSPLEYFATVLAPVVTFRFLLLPAPLLLLPGGVGLTSFTHAVFSLVLADLLSNVHAFITIVTNHAGCDLYRFDTPCAPNSPEFLLRQVLSSANYRTEGGDANDFMHGWLNYQVEHYPAASLTARFTAQQTAPRTEGAPTFLPFSPTPLVSSTRWSTTAGRRSPCSPTSVPRRVSAIFARGTGCHTRRRVCGCG